MKIIMLVATGVVLLLDVAGAIPQSSVGGPLTLLFIFLMAMLAAGIHEAWSHKRGLLGWILSIVASFVGGFLFLSLAGLALEAILPHLNLNGSLAASQHPMRYISTAATMLFTLLGSWAALQLVNRFR